MTAVALTASLATTASPSASLPGANPGQADASFSSLMDSLTDAQSSPANASKTGSWRPTDKKAVPSAPANNAADDAVNAVASLEAALANILAPTVAAAPNLSESSGSMPSKGTAVAGSTLGGTTAGVAIAVVGNVITSAANSSDTLQPPKTHLQQDPSVGLKNIQFRTFLAPANATPMRAGATPIGDAWAFDPSAPVTTGGESGGSPQSFLPSLQPAANALSAAASVSGTSLPAALNKVDSSTFARAPAPKYPPAAAWILSESGSKPSGSNVALDPPSSLDVVPPFSSDRTGSSAPLVLQASPSAFLASAGAVSLNASATTSGSVRSASETSAVRAPRSSPHGTGAPRVAFPTTLPSHATDQTSGSSRGDPTTKLQAGAVGASAQISAASGASTAAINDTNTSMTLAIGDVPAFIADQASAMTEPAAANAGAPVATAAARPFQPVKQLDIALEPKDLGGMTVKLRLANGQLSVTIGVENAQTLVAIEADREQISTRLAQSGAPLEALVIQRETNLSSQATDDPSSDLPSNHGDRPDGGASDANSRGFDRRM